MQISTLPMEELMPILTAQLKSGGRATLVVTGNSMYPTLRHRADAVTLVPVSRELKRGDLILYQRESGQYVLHRIVARPKNGSFICCGDNQWEREPVTRDQVLALADGIIRSSKACTEASRRYRAWVALWVAMLPVRRPLLAMGKAFGRFRRKLKRRRQRPDTLL